MTAKEWQMRLREAVYPVYRALPARFQSHARSAFSLLSGPLLSKRSRWIRDEYTRFGLEQRRAIFLEIARFAHVNRPVDGYYFEFGCHEANTIRMAYDCFRHLFDWHYVGFDSFEGLPEIAEIDRQPIWEKGKLKTADADFIRMCVQHGIPRERLTVIKGFYADSLTPGLKAKLLPHKAAVVYIDCDLYVSTVPVLDFVKDFLQQGSVIVFDDWNCFRADPERGERRAWQEFISANPALRFEPFVQTGMQQSFVFVGRTGISA